MTRLESFFLSLQQGEQAYRLSQPLLNRVLGLRLGVVTRNDDPTGQHRVRATLAEHGGQTETDWLWRLQPFPFLSTPLPVPGQTIAILNVEGNPNTGVYIGIIQNKTNPLIAEYEDGVAFQFGQAQIWIRDSGAIEILSATSISINGQEVATVGAIDSRGDTIVSKGW